MSRRPNALYRLLALLLALTLCPALGMAQEPPALPFALLLRGTDVQTGTPMEAAPIALMDNEADLHWITLSENIALHTVTVELLMLYEIGGYVPVQ